MANDIDRPPLDDRLVKISGDLSDVWRDWIATFYQTMIDFLTQNGIYPSHLTTDDRDKINSPGEGQMIYNITIKAPQIYQNGAWKTFTTS